jgi:prolyl-tRNA editing enzyme YbaK/EbsC (Cys-tRNA(Pro) deacylase)
MERSIASLDHVYLNGGRRGFLVALQPPEIVRLPSPTLVEVAISGGTEAR